MFRQSQVDLRCGAASGELVGIQYLRGVAAVMVLIYHLPVQLDRMGYQLPWLSGLSSGVDIFYVISGFIMWVTTQGRARTTPASFWRRRITRIVPLYWAVTAFVTVMMLLAPAALQTSRFDGGHVAASFLFLGYPHPVTDVIEPVVIPGWTLNHEMFFYLIFGLFLLAPARLRPIGVIATLGALVSAGAIADFPPNSIPGFYTSSMLLEFALGVTIGVLASRGAGLTRIGLRWGWAMLIAGAVFALFPLDWSGVPRLAGRGLASAMLVVGILVIETHRRLGRLPLLHLLGDASYSIYLSHMITLSATSQLWRHLHLSTAPGALVGYAVLAISTSMLTGWLLYRLVEQPLGKHLHMSRHAQARVASL